MGGALPDLPATSRCAASAIQHCLGDPGCQGVLFAVDYDDPAEMESKGDLREGREREIQDGGLAEGPRQRD
eukprot:7437462-Pyramimonas_sp.AAC.1